MPFDAIILGASGYGGGELLRWLSQHPQAGSIRGTSRSFAGRAFADAHPNLRGILDGSFEAAEIDWHSMANSAQPVVFSALPHGELAQTLGSLEKDWATAGLRERLLLVDLSGDFRLPDSGAFEKAYGTPHPAPELLRDFVYGLPEWNRDKIAGARGIASPGCFATALQLALLPLRDLEVGFIAASAVTGSSGSGTVASAGTHHPTRANDFRAYKILNHQHQPEVEMAMQACNIRGQLAFVPQSGPFVRGIFATLQFTLPVGLSAQALQERIRREFSETPFVRLVEGSPRVAAVAGSNFADISVATENGTAAIMVALDNLGKGMAGQSVQAMNLALGFPETMGLLQAARYPA